MPILSRTVLASAVAAFLAVFAETAFAAGDVVWVYPPPNTLVKESPVPLFGYLRGPGSEALEAKVMGADANIPPLREPLFLFKGKVFSGSVPLQRGRNNVIVEGSVLPLLYDPEAKGDRVGDFRVSKPHAAKIEACSQCHTFVRGELTLKQRLPDLCFSCHKLGMESDRSAMKRTTRSQTVTPDCLKCHEPHASYEPQLLRKNEGLCTECHPGLKGYNHDPKAPAEGCSLCHDAHVSAFPKLLKGEALPLCLKCHQNVVNPPKYPKSFHAPVRDGKCLDCHGAHPAGQPRLLKAGQPGLCRTCHALGKEGLHQGKLDQCSRCHESHASGRNALLTAEYLDECLRCHPQQKAGTSSHAALKEGCSACHDPHKPAAKLDAQRVCGRCHRLGDQAFQSAHGGMPMTETRQCATCHDSHRSTYPSLLRGTVHYPLKNGGCASCHVEKDGKTDLRYEGSDNCLRCHGQITGTSVVKEVDKVHKPVSQIDCTACHNPHLGIRASLLLEEPVTLCGWCHGTILKGAANLHGVFKEGGTCYTCHLPHISDFKPLLKRPEEELCVRCHQAATPQEPAERKKLHGAILKGRCTGCHNPHGTNTEKLLRTSRDALCTACHKEVLSAGEGKPWAFLHGPVGAGNCMACHELKHKHGTEGDRFLKGKGSRVCSLCHDTKPEHVRENYRSKMREVQNDCLACHLPHGGGDKYLLVPIR